MDLSDKLRIVLGKFEDTRANFFNKHLDAGLSNGVVVGLWDLPSALKHAYEILVIRDTH